jgi:hypothetical protein
MLDYEGDIATPSALRSGRRRLPSRWPCGRGPALGDRPLAISHRVLIIDPDASAALRLQVELAAVSGGGVWLWHERSVAEALPVLSVFPFELVLLGPGANEEHHADAAQMIRQLLPEDVVVSYGDEISGSTVLRLLGLAGGQ